MAREPQADPREADPRAVDAVLTVSGSMITIAMKSLGAAAEETTVTQYRALVVLASDGPRRLGDLAGALGVAPSSAGRMCDRLARKGLIRRHRASGDRRAVLVSASAAGRQVVAEATSRHRALVADILCRLPATGQQTVADAFREFAKAADEVPNGPWLTSASEETALVPRPRPPVRHGRSVQQVPSPRARVQEERP